MCSGEDDSEESEEKESHCQLQVTMEKLKKNIIPNFCPWLSDWQFRSVLAAGV